MKTSLPGLQLAPLCTRRTSAKTAGFAVANKFFDDAIFDDAILLVRSAEMTLPLGGRKRREHSALVVMHHTVQVVTTCGYAIVVLAVFLDQVMVSIPSPPL